MCQWLVIALVCFGYYFKIMIDSFSYVRATVSLTALACRSVAGAQRRQLPSHLHSLVLAATLA
jgi:hypothetical protein